MKLTFEQIKACTSGAEQVLETQEGIRFLRFNQEEMEAYQTNPLWDKTFSTAGIRIAFTTDAATLTLGLAVTNRGSSRSYFAAEVQVNGAPLGVIRNFTDDMDFLTLRDHCPHGAFSKEFALGAGEKQVDLYLPWSKETFLTALSLENATYCKPIRRERILLMYGDSITHGYDAALPSKSYSNRLADALGMQVFNKAIGGECYFPELAECTPTQQPEIITVAYGTNDWSKRPREALLTNGSRFLKALLEKHPKAHLYVFTPIWRKDAKETSPYGTFSLVAEDLSSICKDLPRTTLIDGYDLVPHDPVYFADRRLHPDDEGFALYFENLRKQLNV